MRGFVNYGRVVDAGGRRTWHTPAIEHAAVRLDYVDGSSVSDVRNDDFRDKRSAWPSAEIVSNAARGVPVCTRHDDGAIHRGLHSGDGIAGGGHPWKYVDPPNDLVVDRDRRSVLDLQDRVLQGIGMKMSSFNLIVSRTASLVLILATSMSLGGCAAANLFGGLSQNYEYQKLIQVLPEYEGLENRTVAVVVAVDMQLLYEDPSLAAKIADGVSRRIAKDVAGARLVPAGTVMAWQYRTPQWEAMPYGDIANQLNVDRVVYLDLYEYRLNPPGSSYEWEGVAAANIGIVERGGIAADVFADEFHVLANFPREKYITRESTDRQTIEFGLLSEFIRRCAWLFHEHEEPKYPDKYNYNLPK